MFRTLATSNTAWIAVAVIVLNVLLTSIPQLTEQIPAIKVYGDVAIILVAAAVKVLQELFSPTVRPPVSRSKW